MCSEMLNSLFSLKELTALIQFVVRNSLTFDYCYKMDSKILTEVPNTLKQLVRTIVRGFYSIEQVVIIDILVRNLCMKEDDLLKLLKFESKQFNSAMVQLKSDKFVKFRIRMEKGPDDKSTRQTFYFINYKGFVNVVKYKLEQMRRKIEAQERDSTNRTSFNCRQCLQTFSDLDVNFLFDFDTNEFRCNYCNSILDENEKSKTTSSKSQLLLAKFNEQMEPIYALLREVEGIKLAPELLEPEPTDLSYHFPSSENKSTEKQDVTVTFDATNQVSATNRQSRKRPAWMVDSCITDAPKTKRSRCEDSTECKEAVSSRNQEPENITQLLLTYEKKNESDANGLKQQTSKNSECLSFDSSDEDTDDEEEVTILTIGNVQVPLHAVTDELINKMTPAEKDKFIKICRDMYADMCE